MIVCHRIRKFVGDSIAKYLELLNFGAEVSAKKRGIGVSQVMSMSNERNFLI